MPLTAEKPTSAYILSLMGGIVIIISGAIIAVIGAGLTSQLGGIGGLIGVFGMITGILVITGAVMMNSRPEQHTVWGIIVVVFSFLSLIGALGGFLVGFVLGLIGGIMGIIWKPSVVQATQEEFSFQP